MSDVSENQSRKRKTTFLCACFCAAVVIACFSPWWAGGRNLAPLDVMHEMMEPWRGVDEQVSVKNHFVVDAVDNYLVYRILAADNYRAEGWVGWSSLTYGGTAQYANTMALYYDWTMQLHRWFDFWTAWHLGIMGQMLLAAIGMLLFLRGRGIGALWAVCGALAFAANSQFVTWIYHRWALSAFCWVPWILWAADRYRSGKKPYWAMVPAFIALAFLGGSLQHCAHVALVVVAVWGEEALKAGRSLRCQLRVLGRYAAWGLLGTALAGMMFVPCIAAYLESSGMGLHSTARMGLYPHGLLQPLFNLLAYPLQIFPSILGRPGTMDALKVFRSDLFFVAYFGSLPVLIAYLACFGKKVPPLARLLILIGLLLPLTPLVKYLYQRMFIIWILGGIYAFAHFMETSELSTRRRIVKATGMVAAAVVSFWTVGSVILAARQDEVIAVLNSKFLGPAGGGAFGYFKDWMQGRLHGFVTECLIWSPQQMIPLGLLVASLVGLGFTAALSARRRQAGAIMVAGAWLLELMVFGSRWITWTDPADYPLFPTTPEVTALQEHGGEGRIITSIKSMESHMAMTPFVPNMLVPHHVATISGFDSIAKSGMASPASTSGDSRSLGRIGISHLVTTPGNDPQDPGWLKVWESKSMALFENQAAVPRYVGFKTDSDKDAFWQGEAGGMWLPLKESGGLENSRSIEVPPGIRWLRIAENQGDGWEYQLAGSSPDRWLPVQRAPDASMLLPLDTPATGPVTVLMRYQPPLRSIGFAISAAALAIALLGAFGACRLSKPATTAL